jgi:PAS domain S-box-containing protein
VLETEISPSNPKPTTRLLSKTRQRLSGACLAAGITPVAIGALVLAGWFFKIETLKRVIPGLVAMNPVTALLFILSGTALLLVRRKADLNARRKMIARSAAGFTAAIGALKLFSLITGWTPGIDQWLFTQQLMDAQTGFLNTMAPNTAFNFLLIGCALLLIDTRTRKGHRPAEFLSTVSAVSALLALIGYAYHVPSFYEVGSLIPMALHTATSFLILAVGILLARADEGIATVFASDTAGGIVARRLLPLAILLPTGLGALTLEGGRLGFYDAEFGSVIHVTLLILLFLGLTWWTAGRLYRLDTERNEVRKESDRFFNVSLDMLATAGFDGYFKRLNPAWEKTVGWSVEQLKAASFMEFVHPDDRAATAAESAKLAAGLETIAFENRYRCKDGTYRWFLWSATADLEMQLIFASARDITERKRAEKEIREARGFLDSVVENIPLMIFIKDAKELRFIRMNEAGEKLLGVSRNDLIGKNAHELFSKEEADSFTAEDRAVLESGKPLDIPEESVGRGDRVVTLHTRKVPMLGSDGTPRYLLGISEDITEQKKAAKALQRSEERFREVVNTVEAAIVELDAEGRVTRWSVSAQKIKGYTAEEIRGRHFSLFYPPEDVAEGKTERLLQWAAEMGRVEDEGWRVRKDGSRFWANVVITALRDEQGKLSGFSKVTLDLSERKKGEEELHAAKEEAERANHSKSEFLSRMSHELRTPLNAILGFGQLLEEDDLNAEQEESIRHILGAGRHLLDLINEVLDISRIEAGNMTISSEPVSVPDVLRDVVTLVGPLAREREIKLLHSVEKDVDLFVTADRQRLKQVLLNLLSNAIKYNRQAGEVRIEMRRQHDEPTATELVRVEVTDSGAGLSAEQLEQLFTPFQRLGAENTEVDGTGLGLALSKRLVELMQGRIGVESAPEKGSTFWIELPATENPLEKIESVVESAPEDSSVAASATVLYIEDNPSNLRLVERILTRRPEVRLLSTRQGKAGIELARKHKPNLVLLDLHLPDIQGQEVLKTLRSGETTDQIPIVVVSADATPGQVQRLKEAGAHAYLTKPISVPRFMKILNETLKAEGTGGA